MTTDDLDSLSDAELSERFAVEIAGWAHDARYSIYWIPPGQKQLNGAYWTEKPAKFATDANAVLPFLKDQLDVALGKVGRRWTVRVARSHGIYFGASDEWNNGFARAACIALVRAKRATK